METMCGWVSCNMSLRAALVRHVHLHVPWVLLTAPRQSDCSQESSGVSSSLGRAEGPQAKHPPPNTPFRAFLGHPLMV